MSEPVSMARRTRLQDENVTRPRGRTRRLLEFPGELLEEIIAGMVRVVKLRGTTNLRLVCKAFDNLVVYLLFRGRHIHKDHILDGHCRKCQMPGSLLTRFLIIKLETAHGQKSHLAHVVNKTVERFEQIQRSCGSCRLPRQHNVRILLEVVAEALPAGRILQLEEPAWEDDPINLDEETAPGSFVTSAAAIVSNLRENNILQGIISLAASVGDVNAIEKSLVQGSKVDFSSEHFTTAIHAAARHGQLEAVQMLLDKGAKAYLAHTVRSTPLGAACFGGYAEIVRLLLRSPGKVQPCPDSQLDASIRLALKGGHPELVDVFLEECKDMTRQNGGPVIISKDEILLIAASCGNEQIVNKMLDEGVYIDGVGTREVRFAYMKNPLELAAAAGRLNVVKLLLERGSSRETDRYHNAFVLAVRERRDDVARFLLRDGANINHAAPRPNHWRRRGSALMTASSHADQEMVQFLLREGVDISAGVEGNRENQGSCALTSACRRGHVEIARLLINAGVNPNKEEWTRGKGGRSNMYYARNSGEPGIVEVLHELGAR